MIRSRVTALVFATAVAAFSSNVVNAQGRGLGTGLLGAGIGGAFGGSSGALAGAAIGAGVGLTRDRKVQSQQQSAAAMRAHDNEMMQMQMQQLEMERRLLEAERRLLDAERAAAQ